MMPIFGQADRNGAPPWPAPAAFPTAKMRPAAPATGSHESFFFRHPKQFHALRSVVVPDLILQRRETRALSFWSAASSSGQEAYSLAMMLLEMRLGGWKIKIKGADSSSQMTARARAGKYLQIEVNRGLPAICLLKYFTRDGLDWQLGDEVLRMVDFKTFDLRRSMSSQGPFDVVFCRNVLMYFDEATKRKVLEQIHGTLFRGGYLLLGGSEIAPNLAGLFERVVIGEAVLFQAL